MLRIKLFAMTLVVGLAGVVYAAGNMQTGSHHNHGAQSADKAPACCQKKDAQKDGQTAAVSCDKDGCCRAHKADAKEAQGESCCDGGACCKGHHQKAGAETAVVKTSADAGAADCCAGGSCCKAGADCCKGHKAEGQTAAADRKHEGGCDCCGDSCATHAGR
jgi:hypothetical protein